MDRKNRDRRGGHQQQSVWLPFTFGAELFPAPSSRSQRTAWKKAERKVARRQHKRLTDASVIEMESDAKQDLLSEMEWHRFLGQYDDGYGFYPGDVEYMLEDLEEPEESPMDDLSWWEPDYNVTIQPWHVGMSLRELAKRNGFTLL